MSLCVLALALLALTLALPAGAPAAQTVGLSAIFVPIPDFPHTGNILGAGSSLELSYTFDGDEYFASPPPLLGLNLYLPRGTTFHPSGFPTCSGVALQELGPANCPSGSAAGPTREIGGLVSSGDGRVAETTDLSIFYAAQAGLYLSFNGQTPLPLTLVASGHYANLNPEAGGEYGPELLVEVPLAAGGSTMRYASFSSLELRLGTAIKVQGKPSYYLRTPRRCPVGGFRVKTEVAFAEFGDGPKRETVTATFRMPCPRRGANLTPTPAAPPAPAPEPPPDTPLPGTHGGVTAPSDERCLEAGELTIHVKRVKGITYRSVSVEVDGRRAAEAKGRHITAPLELRGLPSGPYTVKVTIVTATGRRLIGTRSYQRCTAHPLAGLSPPL